MAQEGNYEAPPNLPHIEFREVCGRGDTVTLWRGWHKTLKRDVAVKILDYDHLTPGEVRRFRAEGRAMAKVNHPNIAHGYGAEMVLGRPYYVMDYVDGYSLACLLKRKGHMKERDVLTAIFEVADALDYVWTEFRAVHGNLRLEHLMVSRDGTILLTELGRVCGKVAPVPPSAENAAGSHEGVVLSPFMSPEQIFGDVALDCRTDIYSLGAIAYQLATGQPLFPGRASNDVLLAHVDVETWAPDPRLFMSGLSQGFAQLLEGMLVKARGGRYLTWGDVRASCFAVAQKRPPKLPKGGVSSVRLKPDLKA